MDEIVKLFKNMNLEDKTYFHRKLFDIIEDLIYINRNTTNIDYSKTENMFDEIEILYWKVEKMNNVEYNNNLLVIKEEIDKIEKKL